MVEVAQRGDTELDHAMRGPPVHVDDEADTARVVFERRVVQTLRFGRREAPRCVRHVGTSVGVGSVRSRRSRDNIGPTAVDRLYSGRPAATNRYRSSVRWHSAAGILVALLVACSGGSDRGTLAGYGAHRPADAAWRGSAGFGKCRRAHVERLEIDVGGDRIWNPSGGLRRPRLSTRETQTSRRWPERSADDVERHQDPSLHRAPPACQLEARSRSTGRSIGRSQPQSSSAWAAAEQ